MAVLIRAAVIAVLLGGCYAPDLRDCTVTCAAADECADGQVCAGGWCAAQGVACGAPTDASETGTDGSDLDPDAEPVETAQLHVTIEHKGKVVIEPLGEECEESGPGEPGDCTFTVPADGVQTLTPVQTDREFDKWTSMNCMDETGDCALTIDSSVELVAAKFK